VSQSGEAPEPEHPVIEGLATPEGRGFLIAGVIVLVAVVAILAGLARGDDALDELAREEARFPSPPPTTPVTAAPATTLTAGIPPTVAATPAPAPPATTVPPTTVPPAPAPTTTLAAAGPTTPPGGSPPATTTPDSSPEAPPYVAQLVPSVAAFPELLATPEEAAAAIDEMLASGRHDVAAAERTATICAAVPMTQPLALEGRWERDGRRIASSGTLRREPPGFGECLDDDGDVLETGAYQYILRDTSGRGSAAAGIVLGAVPVEQRFVNDGDVAVCTIRIAPATTRYFEAYVYLAAPITPGAGVTLTVAAVEQDVETVACDGSTIASFSFLPDSATIQPLDP
jgi:hypothetical protein